MVLDRKRPCTLRAFIPYGETTVVYTSLLHVAIRIPRGRVLVGNYFHLAQQRRDYQSLLQAYHTKPGQENRMLSNKI